MIEEEFQILGNAKAVHAVVFLTDRVDAYLRAFADKVVVAGACIEFAVDAHVVGYHLLGRTH